VKKRSEGDPSTPEGAHSKWAKFGEHFIGDLKFRVDDLDLSANWGWIPLLDAAIGLRQVVEELDRGSGQAAFDFTENDSEIRFARESDSQTICVSSTYTDGQGYVPLNELRAVVRTFDRSVFDEALAWFPELRLNSHFLTLRAGSA
jgi:hypothetical protein